MHVNLIDFEKIAAVFANGWKMVALMEWHCDMCWDNRLLVKCKSHLHSDAF
jgi:hypothetical protein